MLEIYNGLTIASYDIQKPKGERITVCPNINVSSFPNPLYPLLFKDSVSSPEELYDLLTGRPVVERGNKIQVLCNEDIASILPMDCDELIHKMFFGENPLIRFKETYGLLNFKIEVLPRTILCRRYRHDTYLVTFATRITLLTKVQLLTLEQLKKPFLFGRRFSIQQATAALAKLKYGNKIKAVEWDPFYYGGNRALVNSEYYESHPMDSFVHEVFGDFKPSASKITNCLDIWDGPGIFSFADWAEEWEPLPFLGQDNLEYNLNFKCASLSRFLQDAHDMCRAMQKGIKLIENTSKNKLVTFRKFTGQCHGPISFTCHGGTSWLIDSLKGFIRILQRAITIVELQIIPIEKALGPEYDKAKPFRRMQVAIAKYIFSKIALDPLSYVDHKNEAIRKYAKTLIA